MTKRTTAITSLAVTAGIGIGALVGAPALSSAGVLGTRSTAVVRAAASTDPAVPGGGGRAQEHEGRAKGVLDGLVAKGTISQAQADAVLQALKESRPDRGGKGKGEGKGKGGKGIRAGIRRATIEVSAEAIGVTPQDLRAQLRDGRTIADVAAAKGVDLKKVTDALVAAGTTRIAAAVADGHLPQARADEMLAKLPALADRLVHAHKPADLNP